MHWYINVMHYIAYNYTMNFTQIYSIGRVSENLHLHFNQCIQNLQSYFDKCKLWWVEGLLSSWPWPWQITWLCLYLDWSQGFPVGMPACLLLNMDGNITKYRHQTLNYSLLLFIYVGWFKFPTQWERPFELNYCLWKVCHVILCMSQCVTKKNLCSKHDESG